MKRENLESKEFGLIIASRNFPFYAAPEADAVMDGLEERIKELEAENERLKGENESLKIIDENLREAEENFEKSYIRKLEENQQLKEEYEKLKCLALHGMIGYAACKMNLAVEKYKDHEMSSFAVPKEFSEWHRKKIEWTLAYRTTKMKLKEKIK